MPVQGQGDHPKSCLNEEKSILIRFPYEINISDWLIIIVNPVKLIVYKVYFQHVPFNIKHQFSHQFNTTQNRTSI